MPKDSAQARYTAKMKARGYTYTSTWVPNEYIHKLREYAEVLRQHRRILYAKKVFEETGELVPPPEPIEGEDR